MSYDSYHKRKIGKHVLKPETQMMGYGYDPSLSEGSLKPPIFLTSTFVFRTAQDGKDFSTTPPAVASRQRASPPGSSTRASAIPASRCSGSPGVVGGGRDGGGILQHVRNFDSAMDHARPGTSF